MRRTAALLLVLPLAAAAGDAVMRPSARLVEEHPEAVMAGRCVIYREAGNGPAAVEAPWFVRGHIVAADVYTRRIASCPGAPGQPFGQFDREAFNRLALAWPCRAGGGAERDERIGVVRFTVSDWETPHERRAASAGRLWRGMYIERELRKDMEIEIEADLLGACTQ
jgi:hypothetical protein